MFGGRDNEDSRLHIPRTYGVNKVNGSLQFTTYDQKPVNPCNDIKGEYYTESERANCNYNDTSRINVGIFYNDVWAYRVCPRKATEDVGYDTQHLRGQRRWADQACLGEGWVLWSPGAREGGCSMERGMTVCTTPSERYNHGAVMYNDGTMYVYGGYSQRCVDYCDDLWFFDIYIKSWRVIKYAGMLSKLYTETLSTGVIVEYSTTDVPIMNTTRKWAGPGSRWRHSMVAGDMYQVYNVTSNLTHHYQQMAVYGGHRVWHGFDQPNSQDNSWTDYSTYPPGGYLQDLWIYTKELDFSPLAEPYRTTNGFWKKMTAKKFCQASPQLAWDTRFDQTCTTPEPGPRAGHGSAFDSKNNVIWIFGGYHTYYPYVSTGGVGAGPGILSTSEGGFIPYPGYDYYLNDLWYYNLSDHSWVHVQPNTPPSAPDIPKPRADMVFTLLGKHNVIFMNGGYADNDIYDDTWYFNITIHVWLRKTKFVYPQYPPDCTDDVDFIVAHPACTKDSMTWPKQLKRNSIFPFEVLPYSQQPYYWPDTTNGPYYNIFTRGHRDLYTKEGAPKGIQMNDLVAVGTAIFPYAATGPMQYARRFFYSFNSSHNGTLLEWCTSVFGEPTRGHTLDHTHGRANSSIFIAQPRRQRPGWDGCRDRADGNPYLIQELQYLRPLATYGHRATFLAETDELIVYGGRSYNVEQPPSANNRTYPMATTDTMWYFDLFRCINNCSNAGVCHFGYCLCYSGYYGVDCSNTSCAGTSCFYDQISWEQKCYHGCQAGYVHRDDDEYVQDITKLPCSDVHAGESNGVCDGFGVAQCAPPFVGDDCSTKDCKSNCSFNGWCSIEYPVSRCLCQPGYYGNICQHKICLNNCSCPNGDCNITSGECTCKMRYSPYNNTREFFPWMGEDCSYLFAYAGAQRRTCMAALRSQGGLYTLLRGLVRWQWRQWRWMRRALWQGMGHSLDPVSLLSALSTQDPEVSLSWSWSSWWAFIPTDLLVAGGVMTVTLTAVAMNVSPR